MGFQLKQNWSNIYHSPTSNNDNNPINNNGTLVPIIVYNADKLQIFVKNKGKAGIYFWTT